MNEKLIEALGLKPDATDAQIVAAVKKLAGENAGLKSQLAEHTESGKGAAASAAREKAIADKINESGGALNREGAIAALDNQASHDAAQKKSAKK